MTLTDGSQNLYKFRTSLLTAGSIKRVYQHLDVQTVQKNLNVWAFQENMKEESFKYTTV